MAASGSEASGGRSGGTVTGTSPSGSVGKKALQRLQGFFRRLLGQEMPAWHGLTDNTAGGLAAPGVDHIIGLVHQSLLAPQHRHRTGDPLVQIGRAHVCTPVTNAHLVTRLLLEQTNTKL